MNPSNRLANPFLRPSPFAGNLAAGSTAYELHPPRPSKTYEPAYKY